MPKRKPIRRQEKEHPSIERLEEKLGRTLTKEEANEAVRIANRKLSDRFDEKIRTRGVAVNRIYKKFKAKITSLIERESKKHFGTTNKTFQTMLRLNIMQLIKKKEITKKTNAESFRRIVTNLAQHTKAEYEILIEELGLTLSVVKAAITKFDVFEIEEIMTKAREYDENVARTITATVLNAVYPSIEEAIQTHKQITQQVLEAAKKDKSLPTGTIISHAFLRKTSAQEQINRYKQLLQEAEEKGINERHLVTVAHLALKRNLTIENALEKYKNEHPGFRPHGRIKGETPGEKIATGKTDFDRTPERYDLRILTRSERSLIAGIEKQGLSDRKNLMDNLRLLKAWKINVFENTELLLMLPPQRKALERMNERNRIRELNSLLNALKGNKRA